MATQKQRERTQRDVLVAAIARFLHREVHDGTSFGCYCKRSRRSHHVPPSGFYGLADRVVRSVDRQAGGAWWRRGNN